MRCAVFRAPTRPPVATRPRAYTAFPTYINLARGRTTHMYVFEPHEPNSIN
jgi:hypothetical protein